MRQAVLVIFLVVPVCALRALAGDRPKGDRLAMPVPVEVDGKPLVREHGGLFPFVGDLYGTPSALVSNPIPSAAFDAWRSAYLRGAPWS